MIIGATLGCSICIGSASANDETAGIQCGGGAVQSCTLTASTSGQSSAPSNSPTVVQVAATTGSGQCQARNNLGKLVPCQLPGLGWLGSDGCYHQPDPTYSGSATDPSVAHPVGQAGSYYLITCAPQNFSTNGGIVWVPTGAAGAPTAVVAPGALAEQAVKKLTFPQLSINASPSTGADQLVGLPTWLWLAEGEWHPITATAAVPGESVTATATPTVVTWDLGDGSSTECEGPGTPYTASTSPSKPSPTCGHTYEISSAGQANNTFMVLATVAWTVSWTGGGQTGTIPALTSTATSALRVAEVESLNTANRES